MAYKGRRRRQAVVRNGLDSVHDPKDPSPEVLPDQAKAVWGESFRDALGVYESEELAVKSAWREVRMKWQHDGAETWDRCKNGSCYWPKDIKLKKPKTHPVSIGVLVEYVIMDKSGVLHVVRLNDVGLPPRLYWDDKLKACFAFPGMEYEACSLRPDEVDATAREVYEKWHKREAECFLDPEFPVGSKLVAVGAGDSLSYASDKWSDPDPDPALASAQQYIHNHWYDVWVYQDAPAGEMPSVVMITGGELDLHERGLIH